MGNVIFRHRLGCHPLLPFQTTESQPTSSNLLVLESILKYDNTKGCYLYSIKSFYELIFLKNTHNNKYPDKWTKATFRQNSKSW